MNVFDDQLLETWYINHRTNLKLMDIITEDCLDMTKAPRGGGKIGHQLAHMYNVRYWTLERYDKQMIKHLDTVKATDEKTLDFLRDLHEVSADLFADAIKRSIENGYVFKGFKRGVVPLVGSFIHHEAHHRGNIMLTLKLCGYKMPKEHKYALWGWSNM